jgi:glycosyltransferase involved in cell wall biosynthesis
VPVHPRVTLILLSYKQEAFVRDAVEGALAQDYPNLQILISDDCSPDATFAVIEDAVAGYAGPHDVSATQPPHNLGLSKHLQTQIDRAQGEFIILAAGDDISAPQRTTRLVEAWQASGSGPAVIYSDCRMINLAGEMIVERSPVMRREPPSFQQACRGDLDVHGATCAVTASLFRRFPAIAPEVIHEDRVLPFRALLLGGNVVYVDESLVDYRFEGGVSRRPKAQAEADLFWLNGQRRGLQDARQRLADLLHAMPDAVDGERMCRATIREHETAIAFGEAPGWRQEWVLLQRLARGGRWSRTAKIYLRQRLGALRMLYRRSVG